MHLHNLTANQEDFIRAKDLILEIIAPYNFDFNISEIDLLTKDILAIISSVGGDFKTETIQEVIIDYIKGDFYSRFKEIHADKSGKLFHY